MNVERNEGRSQEMTTKHRMKGWALTLGREGQRVRQGIVIEQVPFVIGRSSRADLTLDDERVSRFHAEIVMGEHGLRFRDLNSVNGSFVAGERISDARLRHGDQLRIGPFSLGVCLQEEQLDTQVISPSQLSVHASRG